MVTLFLVAILVVIVIVAATDWFPKMKSQRKLLSKIPAPPGYPLIGHLPFIIGPPEKLWQYFRKLGEEYYPIYKLQNGYNSIVVLLNPDDIEILLTSKKHIRKSKLYQWLKPWLGTGLLTSAGDKWHKRRKILTPTFHFNILQNFVEIFIEQSKRLTERLADECDKPYTNVLPIVTQFALHSICETAMGTKLDETKEEIKEYTSSVYRMGELLMHRIMRPWLVTNAIYNLTSTRREHDRLLHILHNFSMSVIEDSKLNFKELDVSSENVETTSKKRLAMLDLLISAKNQGVDISDEGIREEVDTFMFEGHDTTTASICFTLMLLANHSDVQQMVVDELEQVLETSKSRLKFQDLAKLQYLEQVIKESLRLYPSVPAIGRITDQEILTSTGYTIPANAYVHVYIFDLHHNPRFYPDPYKFDPDRFSPENSQGRHPLAYIPFSAGPRNCIGQKFALLELKTVVASILQKFVVKPIDTPADMRFISHLILKTQHGINVKFELR